MSAAGESAVLATNLAKGIWYRRLNGAMCAAALVLDHYAAGAAKVRVVTLHPNTLETIGIPRLVPLESFFCFYCRKEGLR